MNVKGCTERFDELESRLGFLEAKVNDLILNGVDPTSTAGVWREKYLQSRKDVEELKRRINEAREYLEDG